MPGIDPGSGQPGQPDVPVLRKLLAVPRGAKVDLRRCTARNRPIAWPPSSIPASPRPPDAPLSQNEDDEPIPVEDFEDLPFAEDEKAYASAITYPRQLVVDIQTIGRVRDLDLVQVSIAAGQFVPGQGPCSNYSNRSSSRSSSRAASGASCPRTRPTTPSTRHTTPSTSWP